MINEVESEKTSIRRFFSTLSEDENEQMNEDDYDGDGDYDGDDDYSEDR